MAGGYGGQEIALDVNDTPLSLGSGLQQVAQLQGLQTENQYRSALADQAAQTTAERAQLFPSQLQAAQQAATQNTQAFQKQQVAEAMGQVDPNASDAPDKFKGAMQKLAASGNNYAEQYVNAPWTPQKHQQWLGALQARSPLEASSALSQSAAPLPQLSDEQTQQLDLRFNGMSDADLSAARQRLDGLRQTVVAFRSTNDPAQRAKLWDQGAQAVGRADLVGKYDPATADAQVRQMWDGVSAVDSYLDQRASQSGAGLPKPVIPGQTIKRDDGSIIRVDAAGNTTQVAGPTQKWTTNAQGIETDAHSGATRDATTGSAVGPSGPLYDDIGKAVIGAGGSAQQAQEIRQLAAVESRGVPGQTSSTNRKGVLQLSDATFNRYGGAGDVNNLNDNVKAGMGAWSDARRLAARAGDDTPESGYVVYQQGAGGGPALLSASLNTPNAKAVDVLTPHYMVTDNGQRRTEAQAKVVATAAITKNGGTADMTAGQFVDHIRSQWDRSASGGAGGPDSVVAPGFHFPSGYDESTFQRMALQDFTSGKEPTFVRGPGATSQQRQDAYRAYKTKFMDFLGLSQADLNDKAAMGKAYGGAVTKLVGLQGQVSANEEAASRNADLAISKMQDMGQTPIPALNSLQMAARKGLGDATVPAYQAALGTFLDEYARVMSTNTGSGGTTSDSARNEAYSRISKSSNPEQLKSAIDTLKQDMQNKMSGIQGSIDSIRGQQRSLVPQTPAADVAQNPSATHWPGHTDAQLQAAQQFKGSAAPNGTQANPFVINATGDTTAAVRTLLNKHKPTQQNPLYVIDTKGFTHRFPPPGNGTT